MKTWIRIMCLALSCVVGRGLAWAQHSHEAPHGGTLVVLGEEFAHLEFVLDAASGALAIYVLDSGAERGVRIEAPALELEIEPPGGEAFTVEAKAVANVLTGESVGDSSEFRVEHEGLQGLERFEVELEEVVVRGQGFAHVHFDFPEGNEQHEHDAAAPEEAR